jgi:hypothetical protein
MRARCRCHIRIDRLRAPPPQPGEKGQLAKPEMQFDADPLAAKASQHVYASKEAAAGGYGVGGGGCGCN